jgi:hypothetical protein
MSEQMTTPSDSGFPKPLKNSDRLLIDVRKAIDIYRGIESYIGANRVAIDELHPRSADEWIANCIKQIPPGLTLPVLQAKDSIVL